MSHIGRVHYAWVILGAVMAMNAVSSGIRLSFAAYIDPLVEQYGWSRGGISFAYTLQFLAAIPVVLVVGRLVDRVGLRPVILAASIIATVGVLLTATISQLWQFQLYYGVITGALGTAIFVTVLPVTISRWFYRRLGVALGLMWTSLSWGPGVMGPLMRWAIDTAGWRDSFLIVGTLGGAVLIGAALLLRDRPQEMGLVPYGGQPPAAGGLDPAPVASPSSAAVLSMSGVAVMASFWVLVAVHTLGCIGHSVPLAHMVSIATFAGVPGLAAAGMLTVSAFASLASRFIMSIMSEAWGARWVLALALFIQTAPMLMLLGAGDLWVFYVFAGLFGIGFGGEMVGFPIFNRHYYGYHAPLNTIYSYQMAGALVGMSLGGWLGGELFDLSGDYTWSILVAATAGFLGVAAALTLPRHRRARGGEGV